MARPEKLTPEVAERIVAAIRGGNTRAAAAQYAGIGDTTLYRWLQKGREQRNGSACRELWERVTRAENEAEVDMVLLIHAAAQTEWRAATWWLERRRHGDWGRKDSLDVTIRQEAERVAKELGLDVDAVIAEAERIARG